VFPADNAWNRDVSGLPVDPNSTNYISAITALGGNQKLHADFGGGGAYGIPYITVPGTQPLVPVDFDAYGDESDPGPYPIPLAAPIEDGSDAHVLAVDRDHCKLYELFAASPGTSRWTADSGAVFDLTSNALRPEGWTSADAAGLPIFPGLVRYDEAWNGAIADIGHAFRVTVRATNGYVYPASHRAGSTAGAPPMGARLRLKTSVNGLDPALRTSDPNVRKIFRAMQKYGLIVADNGSDMYISGTFDTRWNNDVLNAAFSTLSASDFDVVQLGWKPTAAGVAVAAVSASPSSVVGGGGATGTVSLSASAPAGGASVLLSSASSAVTVPAAVTVAQGMTSATFGIATSAVTMPTSTTISASYGGVTKATTFTVTPASAPALASVALTSTSIVGGTSTTGRATLTAPAGSGGAVVTLRSSNPTLVGVPASVVVPAGATSATFTVTTTVTKRNATAAVYATYASVTKTASLTVKRK
jgi:hypothetical protein